MAGFNDIPIRQNGKDFKISAEWFNTIRTNLIAAFGSGGYIAVEDLQLLNDNDQLTYSTTSFKPMLQVEGDGSAVTLNPLPFGSSHGFADGKEIVIIGNSTLNSVTIPINDVANGVVSSQGNDIVLEQYGYVLLIWNADQERFIAATSGGGNFAGYHESLGSGNGVATNFNISALPVTDESFIVYRNGILVPKSEYSFSNPTITFNSPPALGQRIDVWILSSGKQSVLPASGTYEVEYIDLVPLDISAKQVQLSSTPATATKVVVDVIGGTSQKYGLDFVVSGDILDWNGLGLQGQVADGDCLRVTYFA